MIVSVGDAGPQVACYGILRGCWEAMQRAEEFWYVDHGAFHGEVFYRVVHNGLFLGCEPDEDSRKLEALNIRPKPWRKIGSHIVVVPPSDAMSAVLGLDGWLDETLAALPTDRPVVVHTKSSPERLGAVLKDAWCLVTDHSNAAIDALVEGVPAIMTNPQRRLGSLAEIESPPMERAFLCHLANNQWTLAEMASGECWKAQGEK